MITFRKHTSPRITEHVGKWLENPSLPPSLSKLMRESVPTATPTTERKQIGIHDEKLTAGMQRIYEQYKAGTYDANSYSQRSCQRHRKYFLSMGIDLRVPFCQSATVRVPAPRPLTKQCTQSIKSKKKIVKPLPAPEYASVNSEPTFRKSKCASKILPKVHRMRIQQRSSGVTKGLGAMAKRLYR